MTTSTNNEIELAKIRVQKLKELSMFLKGSPDDDSSNETNQTETASTEPAYKRKGVELKSIQHSTESKIEKAEYVSDYKLLITFSDGFTNVFDFKNLVTSDRKEYQPYLDITKFKKFKIQRKVNCISWGKENNMQVPGFILYSEKKSSKGWYINETPAELKTRLPKKFYYEMFVDNNVWAGIHVISDLLKGNKSADKFFDIFNKGTTKNNLFEVSTNEFVLKINLHQFGLVYNLQVKNDEVSYKVNFEKEVVGEALKGKKLERYEVWFDKACALIKKDIKGLSIKLVKQ